jgi:hypothetical protein
MDVVKLTTSGSSCTRLLDTELGKAPGVPEPTTVVAFVTEFTKISSELTGDQELEQIKRKDIRVHIRLGTVVCKARDCLTRTEYKLFCERTKLKGSESRKYRKIGEEAFRLEQNINLLPPNRTTVYYVARTIDEQFTKLIKTGTLNSKMKKKDMDACLAVAKAHNSIRSDLIIEIGEVSDEQARYVYDRLNELRNELGFHMKASSKFSRAIAST